MNFFEIYDKEEYKDLFVVKNEDKFYTIAEILSIISPTIKKLKANDCDKVLILSQNHFDFLLNFLSAIFAQKEIYLLSDPKKAQMLNFDFIKLENFVIQEVNEQQTAAKIEKLDFDKVLINLFTSGSSGKPKHIIKSLKNLIIESLDTFKGYANSLHEKKLLVSTSTSPHHMFGLVFYIVIPLCHLKNLIIDTKEVLYPDSADLKDNIFVSTPSFLEKFEKYNVELNKPPYLIYTAGDKLKEHVFKYFTNKNIQVCEIYGSTETGTIAYKNFYEDNLRCFDLVNITTNEESQIVIESPYFRPENITLGDIIQLKTKNEFILGKRSDRILKIQEKRISAQEIEELINKTDFVKDSYCFKYDEKLACAAVLSPKGLESLLKNKIETIKTLKKQIKKYSEIIPQRWKFLYEIPKTQTGKIDSLKIKSIFDKNISLPVIKQITEKENEASIKMVFPKSCNFFEGHFNKFPILPGVIQLYFANMLTQDIFKIKIKESPIKKMKFSHLIRPDAEIDLIIKIEGKNIHYQYNKNEQICSSGVLTQD